MSSRDKPRDRQQTLPTDDPDNAQRIFAPMSGISPFDVDIERWKEARQRIKPQVKPSVQSTPSILETNLLTTENNNSLRKKKRPNVIDSDTDTDTEDTDKRFKLDAENISLSQDSLDSSCLRLSDDEDEAIKNQKKGPGEAVALKRRASLQKLLDWSSSDDDDDHVAGNKLANAKASKFDEQLLRAKNKMEEVRRCLKDDSPVKAQATPKIEKVDEETVNFSVRHNGKVLKFDIPMSSKLEVLFNKISVEEKIALVDLKLWTDSRELASSDSARAISEEQDSVFIILDTHVLTDQSRKDLESGSITDPNMINIVFQKSADRKETDFRRTVLANKSENFGVIKERYAGVVNSDATMFKLMFDNCFIKDNETPAGLDMDDEDTVDVCPI